MADSTTVSMENTSLALGGIAYPIRLKQDAAAREPESIFEEIYCLATGDQQLISHHQPEEALHPSTDVNDVDMDVRSSHSASSDTIVGDTIVPEAVADKDTLPQLGPDSSQPASGQSPSSGSSAHADQVVAHVKIEDSITITDHLTPPDKEAPKGSSPEDEVIVANITSSRDLWKKIKEKQQMRIPEDHPHEPQELTASYSNAESSSNGTDTNGNPLTLLYREQQDPRFVWSRRYSQARKRPGSGARRRAEDRRQHDLMMDQQRLHRRILKQRKAYLAGVGNWWDVPVMTSLP